MEEEAAFRESMRLQREDRGWTQADLAREMTNLGWTGIYQTTVSRMEKGERPIRIGEARGIAKVFGVTVGLMIAKPEPLKPIDNLRKSVQRMEELRRDLYSTVGELRGYVEAVIPAEVNLVELSDYATWADEDLRAAIERLVQRAKNLISRPLPDLDNADAVSDEGDNGEYPADPK